ERPVRVPVDIPPQLDQQGVFTVTLREPEDEDFEGYTVQVLFQEEPLAEGVFTRYQCQLRAQLSDDLLRYGRSLTPAEAFPVDLLMDDLYCRIQQPVAS